MTVFTNFAIIIYVTIIINQFTFTTICAAVIINIYVDIYMRKVCEFVTVLRNCPWGFAVFDVACNPRVGRQFL